LKKVVRIKIEQPVEETLYIEKKTKKRALEPA
jgi:hypothetical protein